MAFNIFERVLGRWANMSGRKKLWNGGSPKLGIFHALYGNSPECPLEYIHSPYACCSSEIVEKASNVFETL